MPNIGRHVLTYNDHFYHVHTIPRQCYLLQIKIGTFYSKTVKLTSSQTLFFQICMQVHDVHKHEYLRSAPFMQISFKYSFRFQLMKLSTVAEQCIQRQFSSENKCVGSWYSSCIVKSNKTQQQCRLIKHFMSAITLNLKICRPCAMHDQQSL